MDRQKMLDALLKERAAIDDAIAVLQRLVAGGGKRRGRPPLWMAGGKTATKKKEPKDS